MDMDGDSAFVRPSCKNLAEDWNSDGRGEVTDLKARKPRFLYLKTVSRGEVTDPKPMKNLRFLYENGIPRGGHKP